MKFLFLALLISFASVQAFAQTSPADILQMQSILQGTSQGPMVPYCNEECPETPGLNLPASFKEKKWKTLFEIKYRPLLPPTQLSSSRVKYPALNLSIYRTQTSSPEKDLTSAQELEDEAEKIRQWYLAQNRSIKLQDIRHQLLIDQLRNPFFTSSDAQMMSKLKELTKNLSAQDFLEFTTALAGYVDYDDDRALFIQKPGAGLGTVTPYDQVSGQRAGICGDIHAMVAKVAELRGWEAFTVGYALDGAQHVVTAMVDPANKNELMIVNYGRYEVHALNDGNSVSPTPASMYGWEDIGTQVRIFKNQETENPTGKMQQIATIPTALGSFLSDLYRREYQIARAIPANENYRKTQGSLLKEVKTGETQENGDMRIKTHSSGFIVYEGETGNASIYGIGVSHDVYKELYRWDEDLKRCVRKQSNYFSAGLSASMLQLPLADIEDSLYVYLNLKGGKIFELYESEYFKFQGLIGYELDGYSASDSYGFLTADGNFATLLGAIADYEKKGSKVRFSLTYETNFGLRDQGLMTDMKENFLRPPTKSNVNYMMFNALNANLDYKKSLTSETSLISTNSITLTRVGGRVIIASGIIHKNTQVMLGHQGTFRPLNVGNSLQNVNLLQNLNNPDGVFVSVGQQFQNKKNTIRGSASVHGGLSTSTTVKKPFVGGSVKINLGSKKKKKAPTKLP